MRIIKCLQKMGFTEQEAQAIFEDAAGGDARAVVQEHIAALEKERDAIHAQIADQTGSQAAPTDAKLQSPEVENPTMQIPDENGNMRLASEAMTTADAELKGAQELAKGFVPAAECAVRFGT